MADFKFLKKDADSDDKKQKNKKHSSLRRRGAAVLALLAVTVAGTLGKIEDVPIEEIPEPVPVVETIDMPPRIEERIEEILQDQPVAEETGFWAVLKRKLAGLPTVVKALLGGGPAFVLGWALKLAGVAALKLVSSPAGAAVAGSALAGAAALGSVCAALKTAYPDVPLKELLTKGEAAGIFIGAFSLCLVCGILPKFWDNMDFLTEILQVTTVIVLLFGVVLVKSSKRKAK